MLTFEQVQPMQAAAPAAAPPVKLEVRNLTFRYGKTVALTDVSMGLHQNRVTAIMGPSGCGKSTLLRTFNRIHELYPGQTLRCDILLDNRSILGRGVDVQVLRTRIGMVHQRPTPFPMSIYENVAYGLRLLAPHTRQQMDEKVEGALREAALWDEVKDILQQGGEALSGGQQQRLCIARTIAPRPEVILLDEPCSALDPGSTARIEELIATLKHSFTLAIVTHNLEQAARIADYSAFMYMGALEEFAPTRQLFTAPQNPHTRAYLAGHFG